MGKVSYASKDSQLYGYAIENRLKCVYGEKKFKDFCEKYKIPYEYQVPVYYHEKNKKQQGYIIDFEIIFPIRDGECWKYLNFIVEIDGKYHENEIQKKKDDERDCNLLEGRWLMVVHLTDDQVADEESLLQTFLNEVYRLAPLRAKYLAKTFMEYVLKNWGEYKDSETNKDFVLNKLRGFNEYLLKQNKECINKYEMLQHKYEMIQMATGVYDSETENTFEDIKQILV